MLVPKKVKYRKWHTFREHPDKVGVASRNVKVSFGSHGLKAVTGGRLTSNQIESARKAISKNLGKTGRMWIRVFPDMPYTKKPAEVKMGKGKGEIQGYYVPIKPGTMVFEVDGIAPEVAKESLRKGGTKLPVKVKIVERV